MILFPGETNNASPEGPGERVKQLEDVNHKLSLDLDQTHAADREKRRIIDDLEKQLKTNKTTLDQVIISKFILC